MSPHDVTPLEQRFWSRVDKENGPVHPTLGRCWVWTGACNDLGYGQIWIGKRLVYAHRFARELIDGPIPGRLEIDHLCRTPSCVNPGHLEVVTHAENIRRGMKTSTLIHRRKTHCPKGHVYDGVIRRGQQKCRTCEIERKRAKRAAAKAAGGGSR